MKRENIMAMADSYMNRYTEDYPFTKDTIFAAFVEGASRMNYEHAKVWRNKEEEPEDKYEILVQDEFGHFWLTDYVEDISHYQNGWKECAACECIIRWAYISDLLPKGVRNDNRRI